MVIKILDTIAVIILSIVLVYVYFLIGFVDKSVYYFLGMVLFDILTLYSIFFVLSIYNKRKVSKILSVLFALLGLVSSVGFIMIGTDSTIINYIVSFIPSFWLFFASLFAFVMIFWYWDIWRLILSWSIYLHFALGTSAVAFFIYYNTIVSPDQGQSLLTFSIIAFVFIFTMSITPLYLIYRRRTSTF